MANPTDRHDGYDWVLWPMYPDEDPARVMDGPPPRGWLADKAWGSIATNRVLVDRRGDRGAQDESPSRQRVVIRCAGQRHDDQAPILGEIWSTPYGLLFASRVAGEAKHPPVDHDSPFDPPTAVLDDVARHRRLRRLGEVAGAWHPIPVVVIRVLLPPGAGERLFVKCADCGPVELDPDLLMAQVATADRRARELDDGAPWAITVLDVALT